jgi:hypothetical protein
MEMVHENHQIWELVRETELAEDLAMVDMLESYETEGASVGETKNKDGPQAMVT